MNSDKSFYFMAGLPRAGSSLLSALLNQNPRFYSGPSSPVVPFMVEMEQNIMRNELFLAYPKPEVAKEMISNFLPQFYSDIDKPVIFDKNRSWVNRPNYIREYFDIEPKILCPVRNLDQILASFIAMCRRNPWKGEGKMNFIDMSLLMSGQEINDENRCRVIAGPGILGQSYDGIKQILESGGEKMLHFIEYDDLVNDTQNTMNKIYEYLDEEPFEHSLDNLENIHRENDFAIYGFPDMHEVRSKIEKRKIDPKDYLPEIVLNSTKNAELWKKLKEE